MNNEVENQNLESEVVVNPVNTENNDTSNNDKNNKNKKIFMIIGIVASIIILGIIAFFVFIFFSFTAPNYIDEKVEEFTSFVDEMFNSNTVTQDTLMNGSLKLDSDVAGLNYFNDITLNFDMGYSLEREIVDLNIGLTKGEDEVNANMYVTNSTVYLDAPDIYSNVLYTLLDENPFGTNDVNLDDVRYAIYNLVKYFGESLKVVSVQTSINGMSARYTYEINDNNKETFVNKLNELITNDGRMTNLLGDMAFTAEDFANMVFVVELKIPSGDLTSFSLTIEDTVISCVETIDDVYNVTVNDELIMEVRVNGDDVNLISKMSDLDFDITYNSKNKTMSGKVSADNTTFTIDVSNVDNNTKDINIEYRLNGDYSDPSIHIVFKATSTAEDINGSLELTTDAGYLNAEFALNVSQGTVSEKTFSNTVDMETLSDTELEEISNNAYAVVERFLPELFASSDAQQFAIDASTIVSNASLYISTAADSCVTMEELSNAGVIDAGYTGRIYRVSDNVFRITVTDSEYMIINELVYAGDDISSSDVLAFDSATFVAAGYTCGN